MPDQCPQLAQLPEKVRKFWEDKQRECHDTLLRFSFVVLTDPSQTFQIEKSGLLYLMQTSLWFEDFPKSSSILALFGGAQSYEKTLIQIPLATLDTVKPIRQTLLNEMMPGKKRRIAFSSGLLRFLFPDPLWLLLSGKDVSGKPFEYVLRIMEDPESWVMTLSELSGKAHGNNPATHSQ
jgi:hypothetical protein